MSRVRVAIADLSRMLSDIVGRVVGGEEDLDLVGQTTGPEELFDLLDRTTADVVVLGSSEKDLPNIALQVFRRAPEVGILAVVGDGRSVFCYRLRPHKEPIGEVSPQELIQAIKALGAGREDA